MAIQTITYDNKVALNENPGIADVNKVTDDDMNEIKSVVNNNANNIGDLSNLQTTVTSSLVGAVNVLAPTILFDNANNSSLDVVLNDSAANYSYLDVFFTDRNSNARFGYTKVNNPNGNNFGAALITAQASEVQIKCASYSVSGTSITSVYQHAITLKSATPEMWTNNIYIIKVIGYK